MSNTENLVNLKGILDRFSAYELNTGHIGYKCGKAEEFHCSCLDHAGLFMCIRCGQAEAELDNICRGYRKDSYTI